MWLINGPNELMQTSPAPYAAQLIFQSSNLALSLGLAMRYRMKGEAFRTGMMSRDSQPGAVAKFILSFVFRVQRRPDPGTHLR